MQPTDGEAGPEATGSLVLIVWVVVRVQRLS